MQQYSKLNWSRKAELIENQQIITHISVFTLHSQIINNARVKLKFFNRSYKDQSGGAVAGEEDKQRSITRIVNEENITESDQGGIIKVVRVYKEKQIPVRGWPGGEMCKRNTTSSVSQQHQ